MRQHPAAPWSEVLRGANLPRAAAPSGQVVVLSAHPDDEVLGVGAWLAGRAGHPVRFVVATDGERSHPDSPTLTPDQLRTVRRAELGEALAVLGHERPDVTHLGLRDAALPQDESPLRDRLTTLLADAALVVAPFEDDGHADHDVVGCVAREVAPAGATLWRYPVWRWTVTTPSAQASWLRGAALLPYDAAAHARKATALRCFRSQLQPLSPHPADAPVVTEALLAHALHAPEVVFT
ncbi:MULTISPECIES: PIG-L family deacetylase [unclassified Aeromicrobium]|uniref:PIG-L deacetylase family protein n=1 Tax=unclassified Aeromicrobium TaxID=2633570 RepID=UPI0028898820|nr:MULTISPECIES: PIG-L family deacetylase [unclassified Aeromicrobium]